MLEKFNELTAKPQNVADLKTALQAIPDKTIHKSVLSFRKRLTVLAAGLSSKLKANISDIRLKNSFSAYQFSLASEARATV